MPDLRQALKDFVATSNSGKYKDESTLLSKFPELSGYNINVLKDFVATSNSGKYATEDELFAKFPEFNLSSQKKSEFAEDTSFMASGSGDGSLEPAKLPKLNLAVSGPEYKTATQPKKEYVEPKPDEQGYLLNTVSALDKGFYQNLIGNPIKGLGTALEGATGKAFLSDALIKFGDYFNNAIDELAPQDEAFKNSLTDQFGQAFGQVASMIVTAGAGGAAGKALGMGGKGAAAAAEAQLASQMAPAAGALEAGKTFGSALFSPSSISAGLSMGQAEFDRAKQAGATDEQAFEAFYKNAAVGSVLEQIPVMQFMKRFNKATAGGLVDYIKNKSVAGLTGGIEEMTTEVLQQLYANKSAQDIYNINQDLFEGVGESGGIGFGVGFLLNAMGANVKLLRQSGRNQEADIVEAQMRELEGRAQKGGPSSYTLNGIKIDAPVVEDMINTMTAADLAKANIEITNDPELKMKMQNKIVTSSIKEQVREANPDLNEESLDAITELEKELRKFEGNTTQSGKDRAAAIRQQIRDIQETPLPAKTEEEVVVQENKISPYGVIAADYLFTAGQNVIMSSDYLIQALSGAFLNAGSKIESIRQKYAEQVANSGLGDLNNFIGTDLYNQMMDEIRSAIKESYTDKTKAEQLFNDILLTPKGLPTSEGRRISSELDILNQETERDAVQKLSTDEGVLRTEQPEMGLQEVGEGNKEPQVATEGTKEVKSKEEVTTLLSSLPIEQRMELIDGNMPINGNEALIAEQYVDAKSNNTNPELVTKVESFIGTPQPVSLKTQQRVVVAPFFNTMATTQEEAAAIRQSPEYKAHLDMLNNLATQMGLEVEAINDNIGGYENENKEEVVEISNTVFLKNATIEQAEEYAALAAALTPQVQESSIAAQYVEQGAENHNANEYTWKVSNINGAIKALKSAKITNFTVDENAGTITFFDVFKFADDDLADKFVRLAIELEKNNVDYEVQSFRPVESRYVGKGDRKKIIKRLRSKGTELGQSGESLLQTIDQSVKRDAEFRGISTEEYFKPERGNRLFNERLKGVADIANRYFKRIFGLERPQYYGQRQIDKDFARRISDAFIAMKHDPNNPEVRAAYEALAKETKDQYQAFLDAGYRVEINNEEPYANSQDMIDDLRDNKRIKIFSTESGFGDNPITPQQRAENPLLQPSGFSDANGQPLLVNDLFRAIHDFFGHSELGNSFGPIGEENAWQVHARMFSPLARKAMTTETRGQNSFVNFSGVNDRIEEIRKEARKLRQEGKLVEAKAKVDEIYQKGSFAEQKVGLLPEEFYQIDENFQGDEEFVPAATVNEVLNQDTKDDTVLKKVLSVLDNLENDLDKFGRETAGINIALPVMKAIIKTLKALVKTGITLQEAIDKAAAQYNVSRQDVIDSIQTIATMREEEGKGVELNEATLPGYDRMIQEIDGIVEKALSRGAEQDRIVNDVISYLQGTKVYENATDTQREALVREARKLFGLREKYAPSAARVLGQAETTVTVNEMTALKDQLRLEARAARDAKNDMNAKRKAIADVIRKLQGQGTITVRKATAMINKLSNLNLYNTEAVERYIDYVGKVFADAEYGSKLSTANNIRKQLRKLSKNKDKSANLRSLSSKFVEIDPSMVEDIDEYNKNAALILDSIKGSSIRGSNVRFAEMVRESDAMQYIDKTIKEQQQKLYDMKLAAIQELLGVDASELNYEQLVELMAKDEPMTKYNESIVRDAIQKAFDVYSAIIKESIKTGKDVFTGEDVEYTDAQKKVVKQFMDMDISALKPKQALEAVDSLMNFLQNQSTAKMEAVVRAYNGEVNARELAEKGIKASPLKKYWSKNLGRFLGEYTTNLNILFEKMFKGFGRGGMVEDKSGVTALKNGKAVGQAQANQIVNEYVKQFYNKKANGEAFNTGYNAIERGMLSFMTRNIIGTQEEMNAEFERRKNLVKESIDVLSQGNEQEVEKAKLYQEAYDKLVEGSTTIDEVMSKADPVNMDAVNFWVEQWANKYDELADVSLNVYNKILGQDINYTPDRFSKLSSDTGVVELSNDDMAFHNNNGTIYKKETGVLMSATRPESLPVNPKNGEPNRYIDLSFDKNNANSMYDALVDINTAGPIRQVEAFLNSSSFRKIVPEANDATILKTRINLFTNNIRQKNPYTNDELSKAVRRLNKLAAVGVGQSLGGITQPIKQVIPVAMNTLINGGGLDLGAVFNQSKNDFINRSGYSIANRGIESQAQVESLNKLIDEAANSKGEALIKKIEDLNKWWLKKFLVNPDVFIARASWMTYYEQSLKKQGIDPNTIDYSTHEVNQEAADYAQRMVDRQQNVSDADLAGKLFADKEPTKQVFVKMLMPFASFRMNQASRLGADLGTVMSNVSTKEDKKIAIRSLAGFAVEMATFRMISIGTGVLIAALVKGVMGREDDEEKDQKKLDAIIKGQMTGTVSDIFSPLPLTDRALQMGTSYALDTVQDALNVAEEDKVSIYSGAKQDFVQSLGLFGIAADRALQLYDLARLSAGGSFKDDFGREKFISTDDRDKLGFLIGPALLVNLGLAPSEVNSIVRSSLSDAKRNASTKEAGGKTKEEDKEAEKRKEKRMESKEEKVDALKELKRRTIDSDKRRIITEMIEEETMTAEEKKAAKEKMSEEKRQKKLEMEELLGEYDSKSEMKRYNPRLYERTFGENSDYYKENKDEMEVEKELRKLLRKREDKRRGYRPKVK